ncbi:MAG: hypothetical protein MJZ53_02985 [Paludibacteraceae bacterium]|nr:hypothetical protein [Paludibacteraceae bacterium]
MPATALINQLSTILFWDMDKTQLDVESHSQQLIQRVLEYGTLQDWRLIRNYYGMSRIVKECQQMRTLDPFALSFICAMSDTKKEEYRCFHFAQSYPTHWNSLETAIRMSCSSLPE